MAVPLSRGHIVKGHLATSPATSPVQRTPHTTWTHTWTWSTQKLIVASCPSPRHCSIPWVGQLQDFFPDPDPDSGKKKAQKFLGDQTSGSGARSWLHIQPDTPGTRLWVWNQVWARAALEQLKMVCWKFGFHIFFSSLWTPLSTLGIAYNLFCPPKNMEQDLRGRGEWRVAQERLSRGTVHHLKGLCHWDCLISNPKLIYFLLVDRKSVV